MLAENLYDNPYGLARQDKQKMLIDELVKLTESHLRKCPEYSNIVKIIFPGYAENRVDQLKDLPFLAVPLFKQMLLKSVDDNEVFKILSSSGTTSQIPSRIVLDRVTAQQQTRVLSCIVQDYLGADRLPMLIVDQERTIRSRNSFNARAAGIIGFSQFGRDHFYYLDGNNLPRIDSLRQFIDSIDQQKLFVFGFTYMLWKYLYQACKDQGIKINFNNGAIIHGGGWKKLKQEAVSEDVFKDAFKQHFNVGSVHNYYGFIEQVGSIYMECRYGHFHTPVFSDIIIRDQKTFEPLEYGQPGLIQALSILPKSYPGHSILTEDLGVCLGEDDCQCGRLGKYFKVLGRIEKSEVRGCSDTY